MATCHEGVALLREDVRQPLAAAVGALLALMGPLVSPFIGTIMKNCDFAAVDVPGFNAPLYLSGAEMIAMYGFGPSMGTAVNIALVSYRDTAFIGFNVDAGAIPDVAVLVECMRLGFDAVRALNQ
jgi:diacylglycerol O-acyltransferase